VFQLMEQMIEKEVTMLVKVMVAEGQLAAATHHACTGGLCTRGVQGSNNCVLVLPP